MTSYFISKCYSCWWIFSCWLGRFFIQEDIARSMDQIVFIGMLRSKLLFLVQVQKSSTVPWIATSDLISIFLTSSWYRFFLSRSTCFVLWQFLSVLFLKQIYVWTKHVKIDYHFMREKVTKGRLNTKFIPANYQLADIFIRALTKSFFISKTSLVIMIFTIVLEGK